MIITIDNRDFELSTKLRVIKAIEQKFRKPFTKIMDELETASAEQLLDILKIGCGPDTGKDFAECAEENWGYGDMQYHIQEYVANLMFTGTPEEQEEKINRFPVSEDQKNAFRELLKLPLPNAE